MSEDKKNNTVNALTLDVEDGWSISSRDWLGKQIPVTEAVETNVKL